VTGAKGVTGALIAGGETGYAAILAQGIKALPPAGKQLMGVALVAHVPDYFVFWTVKHPVQGDAKLHHTQIRGQVTAVYVYPGYQFVPDLGGERLKLLLLESLYISGGVNVV
jgi:hypothetical protein